MALSEKTERSEQLQQARLAGLLPRNPRYLSLDTWRGIACLMIVVLHSSFYGPELLNKLTLNLFAGVPIFFVISGYCIAAAGDASQRRASPTATFFKRRFKRIYPPFWIFLAISAVIVWIIDVKVAPQLFSDAIHPIESPASLSFWQWLGNITLTESWRYQILGVLGERKFFMAHAWTLCYEEQFYVVMGLIIAAAGKRMFAATAVLTAGLIVFQAALTYTGHSSAGFFFDGYWLLFAAGVAVYWLRNYAKGPQRMGVYAVLALFLACSVVGLKWRGFLPFLRSDMSMFNAAAGVAGFGFAALLCLLDPFDRRIHGARWAAPLNWCGVRCYSLYLVHWPVVKGISHLLFLGGVRGMLPTVLITVPVCMASALLVAELFHRYVERRFMNTVPAS